ncbi:MAG: zinc ribbon domain-containing protein [Phycisphaerales bacterium]|nr:MAG: zinc ribbon domain-containing protein [Phycisphaerales bacterium]
MEQKCPRCRTVNVRAARFCAHCGLSLRAGSGGQVAPGRIRHPKPASPPDGFHACRDADHLHFRWGPAYGDSFLLGTEGIAVFLFNGAYPLEEVVLELSGKDDTGKARFSVTQTVEALPVGQEVRIEIPSYELSNELAAPVRELDVTLVSAEFSPES